MGKHAITFSITEGELLQIFHRQSDKCYLRPVLKDIPEDAEVTRVQAEPFLGGGAFTFFLEHPSFPEVHKGGYPEYRVIEWELVDIRKKLKEKPESPKNRTIPLPPPGERSNSNLG